jgi:CheY-like chemotaxis protein
MNPSILLVEDDIENIEMFNLLFASETSYEVRYLASPVDVLQRLDEVKRLKPALFLLDYDLPGMTALELYDCLHQVEGLEHIPALIITACLPEVVKEHLRHRNMRVCYKPFDVDELLATIEQIITSERQTTGVCEQSLLYCE